MSIIRSSAAGLMLALAFLVASCSDQPVTSPDTAAISANDARSVASQLPTGLDRRPSFAPRGLDGEFARVAQEVKGFGGFFRDGSGRLNVYMTDPDISPSQVREQLTEAGAFDAFGASLASAPVQVLEGRYDYLQLAEWHHRMRPVLGIEGVVFTHVDQTRNVLEVGIQEGTSWDAVFAKLEDLEIPAEAVTSVSSQGIVPLDGHTLRNVQRPRAGGPQIVWERPGVGWFVCTLGFNIIRGETEGRSTPDFITNSHCSAVRSQVTGTDYFQALPEIFGGHPREFIGTEVEDPPFFTAPCFAGWVCRWSDALVARYDRQNPVTLGNIYRTEFFGEGTSAGSLEVADDQLFHIRGEVPFPALGETLNKVGRTTGWTRGQVVITCGNFGVAGAAVPTAMLCQDVVAAPSAGGDSGSPVFRQIGDSNHVELYGTLWGGGAIGGQPVFVFSAMENIRIELGDFVTH